MKFSLKLDKLLFFLLLLFCGFRIRPVFAVIFAVVFAIIFTVMSIIPLAVHIDFIQDDTQNTASGFIKLILYLLDKAVTDCIVFYHQYGAVAVPCHYRGIYNTAKGRRVNNDIGKRFFHDIQHLGKFPASEKLAGIGRHRTGKKHIKLRDIRFTYRVHILMFPDQTMAQAEFHRTCLIPPYQDRLTHIRVNKQCRITGLRK